MVSWKKICIVAYQPRLANVLSSGNKGLIRPYEGVG